MSLTLDEARQRIQSYCMLQDRCQHEVTEKLKAWGMIPMVIDELVVELILEKFIDEERFALAFARSKFNQKSWGKNKIRQALKFKQVSEVNIKKALEEIDPELYLSKLKELLEKKSDSLNEKNHWTRKSKLANYLLQKGYESHLVYEEIRNLTEK